MCYARLYLLKHFGKNLPEALDLRPQRVTDRNLGGMGMHVCLWGEGLLLRDGGIFWSRNGQSVPTETGSNVRAAME